jgi:predicted glycosyltransferase
LSDSMNALFFVNTPAQVHEFKYVARTLETRGHRVMILARDYECTLPLLDAYGLEYQIYGRAQERGPKRALELIPYVRRACQLAKGFRPGLVVGTGIISAYTSLFLRKPCIVFTDSDVSISLETFLFKPLVKAIYTPSCFRKNLGRKQIRYNGFKELAYLHPDHFQPDDSIYNFLGISSDQKYVILRLNPLDAFHDIAIRGFSYEDKLKLVKALEPHARVFISSEAKLEPGLEKYAIGIPPDRMHDAEFYAHLLVTDAQTMTTESAILGTPAIRCNSFVGDNDAGNMIELDKKYKLIFNYAEPGRAISKAAQLIKQPDLKQQWREKRQKLLADKINVHDFMVSAIEGYDGE